MQHRFEAVGRGSEPRKRSDNRWEIRITLVDRLTGEKKIKNIYGKLKREVLDKRDSFLDELGSGRGLNASTMTVADWLNKWTTNYKSLELKETTLAKNQSIIDTYLIPLLGKYPLADLHTLDVDDTLSEIAKASLYTANDARQILNTSLTKATSLGLIPDNPVAGTSNFKIEKLPPVSMDDTERQKYIDEARKHNNALYFFLIFYAGLRSGEAAGLCDDDITHHAVTPRLEVTKADGKIVISSLKSEAAYRTIPLDPTIFKPLLQKHLAERNARYMRLGVRPDRNFLFTTRTGEPVHPDNYRRLQHAICKAAGIKYYRIKDLRSTFATHAARSGMNPKALQQLMGHTKIETTLKYYVSANLQDLKDAMNLLHGWHI